MVANQFYQVCLIMPISELLPAPEWVSTDSIVNSGLDLTGLRLPVLTIGTQLLDGLTTVTPNVRYLSLQAWITSSYVHARLPNAQDHFQEFAARVEAAIAIGNLIHNPSMTGAVGALAAGNIARNPTETIELRRLVQQLATTIYLNPGLQLGFQLPGSAVPGLTKERGEPLATCVANAVANTGLGLRFSAGEAVESVDSVDLRDFGTAVDLRNASMKELDLLVAGIIPLDARSLSEQNRVRTYMVLLSLANGRKKPPTEDDFFEESSVLERMSPTVLHHHLDSWLRHLVRDSLAVGHEYVLKEALHTLSGRSHGIRAVSGAAVIRELCEYAPTNEATLRELHLLEVSEKIGTLAFEVLLGRVRAIVTSKQIVEGGLRRWEAAFSELALIKLVMNTSAKAVVLLPVIWCVAFLRAEAWGESDDQPFEGRAGFGWDLIGVCAVIIPEIQRFIREEWTLIQVMEELASRTVEQHLRVSWSRMAADSRHDVALLVADGDAWQSRNEKHAQEYNAGRTNSRISQAINWLEQLKLIDVNGLTTRGTNLYSTLITRTAEVA